MKPARYKAILKRLFKSDRSYLSLKSSPLFFNGDTFFFYVFGFLGVLILAQRRLKKPFNNFGIHWVKNIKSPPLMIAHIIYLTTAYFIFVHVEFLIKYLFNSFTFMEYSILTSHYLLALVVSVVAGIIYLTVVSFFSTKLMVVDKVFIIKSLSYHATKIPLQEIVDIKAVRIFSIYFFKTFFTSVRYRFYFRDPLFWRKGLMIFTKSGKSYFFSVSNATDTAKDLSELFVIPPPIQNTNPKLKLIA